MGECRKCGYVGTDFHKSTPRRCRPCVREANAKWRTANPEYMKTYAERRRQLKDKSLDHLWHRYGLRPADHAMMLEKQKGRCAICNQESGKRLHVDHDHATGAIRGLLCQGCNTGLGSFKDNPTSLRRAADYLERAFDS